MEQKVEKTKNSPAAASRLRKKFIAGNWKMNKTAAEAEAFINEFLALEKPQSLNADIALCVPFTALYTAARLLKDRCVMAGAQNMHYEKSGAFTGEVSAEMLLAEGAKCVIIGHSERRQYFAETDTAVNKKTVKALETGLIPIVCVGETLAQRESGLTKQVVRAQTEAALAGINKEDYEKVVLAYEPIWAIGTGKTATAEDANEVIKYIRQFADEKTRILYGGSMNGKNARELLGTSDIDGGLIGGASLKPQDFFDIIRSI